MYFNRKIKEWKSQYSRMENLSKREKLVSHEMWQVKWDLNSKKIKKKEFEEHLSEGVQAHREILPKYSKSQKTVTRWRKRTQ